MWLFRSHPPRSMWRVVATLNVDLLDYRAISLTTARIGAGLTVTAAHGHRTDREIRGFHSLSLVRISSVAVSGPQGSAREGALWTALRVSVSG